jgi:hypothetical protein
MLVHKIYKGLLPIEVLYVASGSVRIDPSAGHPTGDQTIRCSYVLPPPQGYFETRQEVTSSREEQEPSFLLFWIRAALPESSP